MRWWWNAASSCLPAPLRVLVASPEERLVVEPGGQLARIWLEQENGVTDLAPLDLQSPSTPDLSELQRPDKLAIEIRLPASLALKKLVKLPASVSENLRQVLGFEMDRLTPFAAEQVLYDFRILNRQVKQQKLEIELFLMRRDQVQPWINALSALKLTPSVVTAEGAWPGANLLPRDERGDSGSSKSRLTQALWALLLMLIAVVAISPLLQKTIILNELDMVLAQTRRHANEVADLRGQLEQTRDAALYVLDKRLTTTSVVAILREVTNLLPDDTWVQQFELKGGQLKLRGESAQALGLIERLESSAMFADVGFLSPVVQLRKQKRERFHLSARVAATNREPPAGTTNDR